MEMEELPKITKYIKRDYIVLTRDEAKAILTKIKQADIILQLAFREKRNNFRT